MIDPERRPGILRQIGNRVFEAVKGLPPDLHQESQELKKQAERAREGRMTGAQEQALLQRYQGFFQGVLDHTRGR